LEKLALNLEGETAAFFTQSANGKAALAAKSGKRR
jgi:hypothetical protein